MVGRLILGALFLLKGKVDRCKKMFHWVHKNTKTWTLLTMIIEGNMMVLAFDCGLQLLAPISLNYTNKLNQIACLLAFFVTCMYATMYYPLLFAFEKKSASETILNLSNYSLKSYFFESSCFLLRTFTRGVLQSVILQNYKLQIISLCCSDAAFSILTFIFRKKFIHPSVFICSFLYNCSFFALDAALSLHSNNLHICAATNYEFLLYILVWCIFVSYLLLFFSLFVCHAREMFTSRRAKHQVDNEIETHHSATNLKFINGNMYKVKININKKNLARLKANQTTVNYLKPKPLMIPAEKWMHGHSARK
jgi:hypothetical protein